MPVSLSVSGLKVKPFIKNRYENKNISIACGAYPSVKRL
jgi:hypothetical protein